MNDPEVLAPPPDVPEEFMVVGIGASAGGLKALLAFFEHARDGAGMAYVVVVHLSPEHESRMTELLQQATRMQVQAVTDTLSIRPDHVYVISPRSQLRIYDGKLEPSPASKRSGPSMTIDLFLETLAEAHGNRAAAVILSGSGLDGTRGLRAIKARGGITVVQAPEDAEYDSMPRSAIASGVVDLVLPARDIPDKIAVLWHSAKKIDLPPLHDLPTSQDETAEAEEAVRDIFAGVRARTGHDFMPYKRATLMRRLERRMQVNQLQTLGEYRQFIADRPGETTALLHDLLISVTWFFRDPAAWEALRDQVLKNIVALREGSDVRIWVVGCATGEEVYSLAMLLDELLQPMADPPSVSIFATDIDEPALATARAGVYPESIAEQVSPERLRRFFTHEQGTYRVNRQLRERVMFAAHNVLQEAPFSRIDLVCCRNLLIYFKRAAQERVLDLLHFALRPEGCLFLGMSESIESGHDGFTPVDKSNHIFAQQPRARTGLRLASLPTIQKPTYGAGLPYAAGRRMIAFGELHQRLLEHYAPPSLIVDDRYDVVHLSDRAGHFLQLGSGEPSLNLFQVAPQSVRYELKAALDQAMETMRSIERIGLVFERHPEGLRVNVKVHPARDKASGRTFALVIFDDNAEHSGEAISGTAERIASSSETERLEQQLRAMDSQLSAAIEQYEVQNEELKASNEELHSTNEELRATTEELETGKEELQSINEELVTVNQELKNKVDETTRISDDLTNFVAATNIAALFVDRELRLMRYTPFARDIFNVIPSDVGRPLSDITHRLEAVDLASCIQRVFDSLHLVEREVRSDDGCWYIARFLPYRTIDERIRGAVVTFLDITERKRAEAISRRNEAWWKLVVESVREYAIVTMDDAGDVKTWNPGARTIFGYEASEIVGKSAALLFTPEDRDADVPADEMRRARESGRAEDDRWLVRKSGERFFASGILAPVQEEQTLSYVKVLRDLTDQKHAEQRQHALLEGERISRTAAEDANRSKDDFLAILSHELRNPLSLMLMQAEILLRAPESKQSGRLSKAAKLIHEMVRAQAQLVEDMVDVSRARTGKLMIDRQLLPLTFVIADSIGALRREAQQKDVTLDMQTEDTPLIVKADSVRVRQIAWNLLNNALKFTPPQGTIRIRLARDGDYARLDVEDTGRGIAPEAMPHIFEWFNRLEKGAPGTRAGMGIGLALVRQLVELHEGRVEAYSEGLGKGARFSVWLPLDVAIPVTTERVLPMARSDESRLAGVAILIVDDAEANGTALRDLLEFEGAQATVETQPERAIEIARKHRFDLVISDIAMPRFNGYQMLRAIRASTMNADTPAIAYSGFSGPKELDLARNAGFNRHLTKPIDVETLLATIEEVAMPRRAAD